jgi:hypothetical protein
MLVFVSTNRRSSVRTGQWLNLGCHGLTVCGVAVRTKSSVSTGTAISTCPRPASILNARLQGVSAIRPGSLCPAEGAFQNSDVRSVPRELIAGSAQSLLHDSYENWRQPYKTPQTAPQIRRSVKDSEMQKPISQVITAHGQSVQRRGRESLTE